MEINGNLITSILCMWLLLDIIALDLISRRKNGMNDLFDLFDSIKQFKSIWTKIFTIYWLLIMLPTTIPASIYKIINKNKDGNE